MIATNSSYSVQDTNAYLLVALYRKTVLVSTVVRSAGQEGEQGCLVSSNTYTTTTRPPSLSYDPNGERSCLLSCFLA